MYLTLMYMLMRFDIKLCGSGLGIECRSYSVKEDELQAFGIFKWQPLHTGKMLPTDQIDNVEHRGLSLRCYGDIDRLMCSFGLSKSVFTISAGAVVFFSTRREGRSVQSSYYLQSKSKRPIIMYIL